jgi:uncharacterized protein YndB with AHSA1/START domain
MPERKSNSKAQSTIAELLLTRVLDAPRERVFKAWSDATEVAKWWGPKDFTNPVCEINCCIGGTMRIHMRSPDGTVYPMSGTYREVTAPERIVFISAALDGDGKAIFQVLHTVTFAAEGAKTRLTLQAKLVKSTAAAAPYLKGQEAGWTQSLDRLDREVTGAAAKASTHHGTFVLEREFAFKPEEVFAAWADPAAKARWFVGPDPWRVLERESEFRVGGVERVKGGWPGGMTTTFNARYHNIVPNERIVYAYDMRVNETHISISLATIEFKAEKSGSRLILTEQGVFLDGYDDAGAREKGTRMLLEQLDAALRYSARS